MAGSTTDIELKSQALIRQTRRVVGAVVALVLAVLAIGALITMRYVGHEWSKQDVVECQSSAFVDQAGRAGGEPASAAAMKECLEHRRDKRWGPWGAFGNADDRSKYNGADD